MTVQLYSCDCLDYLMTLPDKSIDVIVTDPPYGIGESWKKNATRGKLAPVKDYGNYNWDEKPIEPVYLQEILRVSKNQVIFGGNYYADQLPPSSAWIVWDKVNGENDFADCELAWTSYKKAVRQFTYMWNGFIKQKPEVRYTPTQKPLSLMLWVIENYTQPGDTVLDPFFGSGSTGVACQILGRNFVGVDKDPQLLPIAEMRIKAAQAQPNLFEASDIVNTV